MPNLIDTHCHLDADAYKGDVDAVVARALERGVWIITVGSDAASSRRAVEIAAKYPEGVYAAIGFHPGRVQTDVESIDRLIDTATYNELVKHPKVVAIGEVGLDYSDFAPVGTLRMKDPREAEIKRNQQSVLSWFLELAREHRLPLLMHCRDAHEDLLRGLEAWNKQTTGYDSRGIVHCFSGSWKDARRYFTLGFNISVTGIMSHGRFQNDIIQKAAISNLALESDCPHLTPLPWDVRRNEPAYLETIAAAVAGAKGVSVAQLAQETTESVLRMFKKIETTRPFKKDEIGANTEHRSEAYAAVR